MNFERLHTFRLVVQLGSFSGAAEELFLSQPAVSLQVRQLEKELGVSLLERGISPARPTAAGQAVLKFADQVLAARDALLREIATSPGATLVTIGCSPAAVKIEMPRLMARLRNCAPHIQLRVMTIPPDERAARLQKGELDFMLTTDAYLSDRTVAEPFATVRLVVAAAPSHPLAGRGRVTAEEVAAYPFALLSYPWTAQRRFLEWASNQAVEIDVATELPTFDGLISLASRGEVLAVVGEGVMSRELQRGELTIIPTPGLPIDYTVYLAHRAGPLSEACAIVKEVALALPVAARAAAGTDRAAGVR